jgi:ankyrin repeat protein
MAARAPTPQQVLDWAASGRLAKLRHAFGDPPLAHPHRPPRLLTAQHTSGSLRWGAVHAAARAGATEVVAWLHRWGVAMDTVDGNGWSPLHYACAAGQVGAVQHLLRIGCVPPDLATAQLGGSGGWRPGDVVELLMPGDAAGRRTAREGVVAELAAAGVWRRRRAAVVGVGVCGRWG